MVYVGPLVVKVGVTLIPFANPCGICISVDGAYAYVACSNLYVETGQACIAKIDLATNTVVATWVTQDSGVAEAKYLAVSPDGTKLYYATYNTYYVYILSTVDGSLIATVEPVQTINHVRADYAGHYVYLCGNTRTFNISVVTNVLSTYYASMGPVFDMAINAASTSGWAPKTTGGDIWGVALPTSVAITYPESGAYFAGIVLYQYADYLYIACPQLNTVRYYSYDTGALVGSIPVGSNPTNLAITPNNAEIYVVNSYDGTVSVISTATNTVTHTITFGTATGAQSWDSDIAITPDGSYAYVTSCFDNTVSVISTSSHSVIAVIG